MSPYMIDDGIKLAYYYIAYTNGGWNEQYLIILSIMRNTSMRKFLHIAENL